MTKSISTDRHSIPFEENIVSSPELCRILGISRVTEWRWRKNGLIQSRSIGGKRFYLLTEVLEKISLEE